MDVPEFRKMREVIDYIRATRDRVSTYLVILYRYGYLSKRQDAINKCKIWRTTEKFRTHIENQKAKGFL
jgi:DNA-binding MarR family transcriptional regulator